MKQALYIQSASAISPQHTFEKEHFLQKIESSDAGKLLVTDVDFKPFINPVAIRRMSRLMKITDMEHFLQDMIQLEEGAMNPTLFIQSTYNSPNGWIALQTKSTAYNQTYVHRGCSMELALLDAQLLFSESSAPMNVLVGCYDEITDDYITVKEKVNYWKRPLPNSLSLLQHSDTLGTIGGEGAAFFTFSNEQGKATAVISDIEVLQHANAEKIATAIQNVLERATLTPGDIDVVLTGMNGDSTQQQYYQQVCPLFDKGTTIAAFKHLCGEYDTATGFGIWLADWLLQQQSVPELFIVQKGTPKNKLRHILLINHYILGSASVLLISKTT